MTRKLANELTLAGIPAWTLLPLNLSCSPLIKSEGAIFIGVSTSGCSDKSCLQYVIALHLSQYQHLIVIAGFQPIEGSHAHTFIRKCWKLKKKLKFQELDSHQTTPKIHLFSTEKISYSFFSYSFFRFFSSGTIKDAFKRTDENLLLIPLEFFPLLWILQ